MDRALGHRDQPTTFPVLDELDVAELRQSDLLRVTRASGTACPGLGHIDVPTVEQRYPVLVQTMPIRLTPKQLFGRTRMLPFPFI